MSLVRMITRYADGQDSQTLRQRLAWKIYINLIMTAVFIEGRAGFVRGWIFDAFGV